MLAHNNLPFTYGQEWRYRARNGMTISPGEQEKWREELAWEQDHKTYAGKLDTYIGQCVKLVKTRECVADGEIRAGTEILIRDRFRDRFLGYVWVGSLYLLLKPEWVTEPIQWLEPTAGALARDPGPIALNDGKNHDEEQHLALYSRFAGFDRHGDFDRRAFEHDASRDELSEGPSLGGDLGAALDDIANRILSGGRP